jgi:ankyrin repeat protein
MGAIIQCAACGDPKALEYVLSNASESVFAISSGGYVELLNMIIDRVCVDINSKGGLYYGTALMYAADNGHVNCVEALSLRGKSNVDDTNTVEGQTALIKAAISRQIQCVDKLISFGANVNITDDWDRSALIYASEEGYSDIVELLISKGNADLTRDGESALTLASLEGHIDVIQVLGHHGVVASIDSRLWLASCKGDLDGLISAIAEGGNVNVEYDEDTALVGASRNGHADCLELLLSHGAAVETENKKSAVVESSRNGHVDCLELLLSHGAAVETENKNTESALFYAVSNKHFRCIELLVLRGNADVNTVTCNGRTPLMEACSERSVICVEFLLSRGADINVETVDGETALSIAKEMNHATIIEILKQNGAIDYEGSYKDGKIHGKGIIRYPNGDLYEGHFKDGKKYGKGAMRYADGRVVNFRVYCRKSIRRHILIPTTFNKFKRV